MLIAIHLSQPFPAYFYGFRRTAVLASGTGASGIQASQNWHGSLELWNPYCCLLVLYIPNFDT